MIFNPYDVAVDTQETSINPLAPNDTYRGLPHR